MLVQARGRVPRASLKRAGVSILERDGLSLLTDTVDDCTTDSGKHRSCIVYAPGAVPETPIPDNALLAVPSGAAVATHRAAKHHKKCCAMVAWTQGIALTKTPHIAMRQDAVLLYHQRSMEDVAYVRESLEHIGCHDTIEIDMDSPMAGRDASVALRTARFVVCVCGVTPSNTPLLTFMAAGIPVAVWDTDRVNALTIGNFDGDRAYWAAPGSSAPHWHPECGLRCSVKQDVIPMLEQMCERWKSFRPQQYIKHCRSDAICKMEFQLMVNALKHRGARSEERTMVHVLLTIHRSRDPILATRTVLSVLGQNTPRWRMSIFVGSRKPQVAFRMSELASMDPQKRILVLPATEHPMQHYMNDAATLSKERFVTRIHAGDMWTPDKLSKQLAFARTVRHASVIGCVASLSGFRQGVYKIPQGHGRIRTRHFQQGAPFLRSCTLVLPSGAHWDADLNDDEMLYRLKEAGGIMYNCPEVLCMYHDEGYPEDKQEGDEEGKTSDDECSDSDEAPTKTTDDEESGKLSKDAIAGQSHIPKEKDKGARSSQQCSIDSYELWLKLLDEGRSRGLALCTDADSIYTEGVVRTVVQVFAAFGVEVRVCESMEKTSSGTVLVPTVKKRYTRTLRGRQGYVLLNAEPCELIPDDVANNARLILDWEISQVRYWHARNRDAWWFPTTWWTHPPKTLLPLQALAGSAVFIGSADQEPRRSFIRHLPSVKAKRAPSVRARNDIVAGVPLHVNIKSQVVEVPYLEVHRISSVAGVNGMPVVTHIDAKSEWRDFLGPSIVPVATRDPHDMAVTMTALDLPAAQRAAHAWWSEFSIAKLVDFTRRIQYSLMSEW